MPDWGQVDLDPSIVRGLISLVRFPTRARDGGGGALTRIGGDKGTSLYATAYVEVIKYLLEGARLATDGDGMTGDTAEGILDLRRGVRPLLGRSDTGRGQRLATLRLSSPRSSQRRGAKAAKSGSPRTCQAL